MTEYRIDPIPTDHDACIALMLDAMRDCTTDIAATLPYLAAHETLPSRFDIISDYDDYFTAATRCLDALANTFLAHTHMTAHDALAELMTDDDFIESAMTADFSTPLFDLIHDLDD